MVNEEIVFFKEKSQSVINGVGMLELENHQVATLTKIVNLGNDHQ